MVRKVVWQVLPLITFLIQLTIASPGDDLYAFLDCLYQCEEITCHKNPYHIIQEEYRRELEASPGFEFQYYNGNWHFDDMPLPLHLRLLLWNCESNCDYQCQQIITGERKEHEEEIYQFHGKWPFWRIFGIQELASMIFSIGNFVVHYIGFKKMCRAYSSREADANLKYAYFNTILISVITMGAWLCSTIFHIRDFDITERMDYYFAGLTVLSGFHSIGARILGLFRPDRKLARYIFGGLCVAAYSAHIYRLVTDWLYTYNMQANVTVGLLQNGCLCILCYNLYSKYYELEQGKSMNLEHLNYIDFKRIILPSFYSSSPKLYSLYPLILSTIVVLGMSLEIFDFPPFFYDLIDAHSLWHLVTIFPAYLGWYDWMIWDINENVRDEIASLVAKKND